MKLWYSWQSFKTWQVWSRHIPLVHLCLLTVLVGQGCCLMGARSPQAPTMSWRATRTLNKEPTRVPKTYDSYGNSLYAYFQWRNDRIPCSLCAFEMKTYNVCLSTVGKKFPLLKINKQIWNSNKSSFQCLLTYLSLSINRLLEMSLRLQTFYFNRSLKGSQKIFLGSSLLGLQRMRCFLGRVKAACLDACLYPHIAVDFLTEEYGGSKK